MPSVASMTGSGDCGCIGGFATFNHLPSALDDDCQTGGPGCLFVDQIVTLSDGTKKRVDEVLNGDKIMGLDAERKLCEQEISEVTEYEQNLVKVKLTTTEIICSDSHPFFLDDGRTMLAPCLDPGDRLMAENGQVVEVISVTGIGSGPVVGWQCSPHKNFLFAGVLHHNKTRIATAEPW